MMIHEYRAHLRTLADECFDPKHPRTPNWPGIRSKRSRELSKAAIRLSDSELVEFRSMIPDDQLMTFPAYGMRDVIHRIQTMV